MNYINFTIYNTHGLYTNQEETSKLLGNPSSKPYLYDSYFAVDCLVLFKVCILKFYRE